MERLKKLTNNSLVNIVLKIDNGDADNMLDENPEHYENCEIVRQMMIDILIDRYELACESKKGITYDLRKAYDYLLKYHLR